MNAPKNSAFWTGLCFALSILTARAQSLSTEAVPQRCGTAIYEQLLRQRDPHRVADQKRLNELIQGVLRQKAATKSGARVGEVTYRIPVVVHVVHNNAAGTVGGANNPNISDEQIISQIQVLNDDYRRREGTRGFNTNPVGADTGIEFVLAKLDPSGNTSTGITRHYYPQQSTFDIYQDDLLLSQIAYWPSDRYLNLWVAPLRNDYLGYSQFPTAPAIPGISGERNELTDGVIIDYKNFGNATGTVTNPTYLYGRTATHEIGHWLGLLHTWGDAYCGEDYCEDTPPTESPNQTTQCTERFSTCNGVRTRNQIENYLDYSPDGCMNLFTKNQAERMRAVLEASPRRARLIRSVTVLPQPEQLTVNLSPNPNSKNEKTTLEVLFSGLSTFTVGIFDLLGRQVSAQQYTDSPSSAIDLPLHTFKNGVYLVKVTKGKETITRRLLIH
ncbi:M43 family zinc metalloprotease [Tellurirhabdus bombi]|uniref:M43 family zinc metalloprotease n=1 Tax=Tellurirhabdus bombi TaxID=2907205 RepID=UPI001EEEE795|nr:M43 family zinc metalloprotease [Tellurirhabdus bombi]